MPGLKTNERPGTRAVLRHYHMSATKARQVLDLIRGEEVERAEEILRTTPREAARVISKLLGSAVANARNNDGLDPDELYVSACYADEGTTLKRWRPRARGRATRIRKRTCHITVIVSRLPEDRLARRRARQAASAGASRARRVAASRRSPRSEEAAEQVVLTPRTEAEADYGADEAETDTGVEEDEAREDEGASRAAEEDIEADQAGEEAGEDDLGVHEGEGDSGDEEEGKG